MTSIDLDNDKHRLSWVADQLDQIPSGGRILDAGAGEQRFRPYCQHLDYVSQDFAQYVPDQQAEGLHMKQWDYGDLDIVCDITSIPEQDSSFDAILCSEVLEHVPNPVAVLHELARLLKPEGRLIITAPFVSLTHFAPYHFATGFNRYFYQEHLGELGFQIDTVSPNGNFFKLVAQELKRVKQVAIKHSHDRPNLIEKYCTKVVLSMLERFSRKDTSSSELACFGMQIVATKRASTASRAA